jgi:low affinity Fe/Cu permease
MKDRFRHFSHETSQKVGSPMAFALAIFSIVIWLFSGPVFNYSDTWQLIINTSTTIITFLMVFLIQNAQNRDSKAVHLKLDELIRSIGAARNELLNLEELGDDELERLAAEFKELHTKVNCTIIRRKDEEDEVVSEEKDGFEKDDPETTIRVPKIKK